MTSDQQTDSPPQSVPQRREVTIVAHDIGPVGGMERVLSELLLACAASATTSR